MTTHGVARRFPGFFESIALGGDGMTHGDNNESAVHFTLTHFKDDFIHSEPIASQQESEQGAKVAKGRREGRHAVAAQMRRVLKERSSRSIPASAPA